MFRKIFGCILLAALVFSLNSCSVGMPSFVPFDSDENRDSEESSVSEDEAVSVLTLNGRRYSFSGESEVWVSENDVLNLKRAGVFRVTGNLSEGGICIDVGRDGAVRLLLDGVSLSSTVRPCLTVRSAASVVLETVFDSVNCFFSTAETVIDAESDVVLCGEGSLSVSGADVALRSSDAVVVRSGKWTLTAARCGFSVRNRWEMTGGTVAVGAAEVGVATEESEIFGGGIFVFGGALNVLASDVALSAGRRMTFAGGSGDFRAPTLYRFKDADGKENGVGKIEFLGGNFPSAAS